MMLRVPFRAARTQHVAQPVSHIDVVPTLLELMGSRAGQGLAGESLMPLAEGKRRAEDHVFIEWHTPPKGPNGRTVISPDGWKMALYDTDNCMLFNRRQDPLEMQNLYYRKESGETIRRLHAKLDNWQRRVGDKLGLP
jgi:arylsulfatase A-like enzyme